MESHKTVSFYEKCRLCLDKKGVEDIFKIDDLSENILVYTGVKVSPTDNLPQKICLKCFEIIINAKELRLLATKNDLHLKSLFGNEEEDLEPDIISNVSLVQSTYLEPEVIIDTKEQKYKKMKVEGETSNDSYLATDTNEEQQTREIKVGKNIFEPSSSAVSNRGVIKVSSKEDYINAKNKMKYEVDFDTIEYECEKCSKSFETWKKLYLHIRLHNKNIPCPLDGCGKMFALKGDLEKHLRTHTGVRPFACHICDKTFTQHGTLKVHKETVHHSFELPPA